MKVLIIDDDALTRHVIDKFLKDRDFVTYHAENGLRALDVLRLENDITKLLLDANMPEMNAFEMLKAIQEDDLLSTIEYDIHIISNWEKEYILEQMMAHEVDMKYVRNILRKPIDMYMMVTALSI